MEELKVLFIIYILFISISIVIGLSALLIVHDYANIIFGSLLILSSLSIIYIFINSFVINQKEDAQ